MQPYQQASEERNKQVVRPFEAAGAVAGLGLKTAVGGRIMSMLSKYVPPGLAAKGLSKIDPRLGKFLTLGQEAGHSQEELTQFIGNQVSKAEAQQPAKEERNIIEQESPGLHKFIDQEIRKGRKPMEAGALAQNSKAHQATIKKLEKTHKTPWSQIIQSIYGMGEKALPSQNPGQGPGGQSIVEMLGGAQGQQPQQGQQQGQGGPGQQALMDILNRINQRLGQ